MIMTIIIIILIIIIIITIIILRCLEWGPPSPVRTIG